MSTRLKEIIKILKESDILSGINPDKLYNLIEKLGPTYIKLGQILSTRTDLIGEEYASKLSKLRSNVTPTSYSVIEKILNDEYDNYKDIFSSINKAPLGSASIAQVHYAKLKTGEEVVLKIKHPKVEEQFREDIQILKKAIDTLHINKIVKIFDIDQLLDELYTSACEELNFNKEIEHLIVFSKNNEDIEYIECPKVYTNISTNNIIVMEYINGIKINDIDKLGRYNLENIAELLCKNYIKQALDDGFFHADPHFDNIVIKDNKIVFLDLGMMGYLTHKNRTYLQKCIKAIINKDYYAVASILVNMSKVRDDVNYEKLTKDIRNILESYSNLDLEEIDTTKFIKEMFLMLHNNNITLDRNIVMLIRGIGIIEGVIENLDPSTSLLKVLTSREEERIISNFFTKENAKQVGKKIVTNTSNLVQIPNETLTLLKSINNGTTKFKFELSDSNKQVDKIESLVHEIILGFIDGCLIVSMNLVSNSDFRFIILLIIILISVWLLIRMISDVNKRGY